MLEDMFKSFRESILERIANPLLGSFAFSWLVINFQLFVILLGEADLKEKLGLLDSQVVHQPYATLYLAGLPLLAALAFIFIYPIPSRWVYSWWRQQQNKLHEIRKQRDDEKPMTRAEEQRIRTLMRGLEAEARKGIKERDDRIDELNVEIATLRTKLSQVSNVDSDLAQEAFEAGERIKKISQATTSSSEEEGSKGYAPSEGAELILRRLGRAANGTLGENNLFDGFATVYEQAGIDELEDAGLVSVYRSEEEGNSYSLTKDGRRFAVVHGYASAPP